MTPPMDVLLAFSVQATEVGTGEPADELGLLRLGVMEGDVSLRQVVIFRIFERGIVGGGRLSSPSR